MIKIDDNIKGLIFDCDGTLVDSMPAHWEAWHETFAEYGLKCTTEYLEQHAGMPIKDTLLCYLKDFDIQKNVDPDEFVARKHARSLEKLKKVKPIQDVVDVALKYKGKLAISVASGGSRKNVLTSLDAIGMGKFFDIIITADDPLPGKPNPDIFLFAAYQMKVKPGNCLVFEDGEAGFKAAEAAGMQYIDVRKLESQKI